jgi:hypothetical protein
MELRYEITYLSESDAGNPTARRPLLLHHRQSEAKRKTNLVQCECRGADSPGSTRTVRWGTYSRKLFTSRHYNDDDLWELYYPTGGGGRLRMGGARVWD